MPLFKQRTPRIEGRQVSHQNIEELLQWSGGDLRYVNGDTFRVDAPWSYGFLKVGDWIVCSDNERFGWLHDEEMNKQFEEINDDR